MKNPNNAFIAGPIVTGENFFGRKSLMQTLEQVVLSGTSVILIGERRIGKTSVLHEFKRRYLTTDNLSTGIIQPIVIHSSFVSALGAKDKEWLTQEISRGLLDWSEEHESSAIAQIINKSLKPESDHTDLIRCIRRIREDDLQVMFLFDEVDAALIDGPSEAAGLIRAIATEGHLTILATSFLHPAQVEINNMAGAPWFNLFRFYYISLFNNDEALELLTTLSRKSGREFTQRECLFLQDVFGNFPFYLQLAGHAIFQKGEFLTCNDGQRDKILMSSIEETSNMISSVWQHSLRILPSDLRESLIEIAHHRRVSNKQHLSILNQRGLVIEQDGKFRVYSRAFEECLRQLPQKSVLEKASDLQALRTFTSIVRFVVDEALKKAIEIAANKYLGVP